MSDCPICGEPSHGRARCIDILKAALKKARAAPVLDSLSNSPQPVLESKSNGAFDKRAYQREYMKRKRAEAKRNG